jgi:hypothetical protein
LTLIKFKIITGPKYKGNILNNYYKIITNIKSKKTPIKLDEKIVLIPATEAIEDVSIAIPSPIQKKKRTIKKRPKLILVESSDDKVVPKKPIDPNADKIFNPFTNRHVKNTKANRKKIEKQTLKRGGKLNKKTIKIRTILNFPRPPFRL